MEPALFIGSMNLLEIEKYVSLSIAKRVVQHIITVSW